MNILLKRKKHWEAVYETKEPHEVSWTQEVPKTALNFIHSLAVSKDAKIIDIGGGDSNLADHLLNEGYTNITVLDISEKAIAKAKKRLGAKANLITWIVCDITNFKPNTTYDVWHDRATLHFLTKGNDIKKYIQLVIDNVNSHLVIGTFSENGPKKCSGLNIKQYSILKLSNLFAPQFKKTACITKDHITPFKTVQNFTFCTLKKQ